MIVLLKINSLQPNHDCFQIYLLFFQDKKIYIFSDRKWVKVWNRYKRKFVKIQRIQNKTKQTHLHPPLKKQETNDDWESLWNHIFSQQKFLHQAKTEWASLTETEKKKMESLITLAIDLYVLGLSEDLQKESVEKNKIFIKLLIQEWNETKKIMKLVGDSVKKWTKLKLANPVSERNCIKLWRIEIKQYFLSIFGENAFISAELEQLLMCQHHVSCVLIIKKSPKRLPRGPIFNVWYFGYCK